MKRAGLGHSGAAGLDVRLGQAAAAVRGGRLDAVLQAADRGGRRRRGPGIAFGEYGEGYVRIGLVENEHRIRQAARSVKKFLANSDEILGRAHNALAAQ